MAFSVPSMRTGIWEVERGIATVLSARPRLLTSNPTLILVRHAQHKQQGSVNGSKDGAGRRLGAKKGSEEYVIPGQIIFRQRGTKWHPGENVGLGKDHTIFALQPGYVKYYKNPALNPKRRYIGVALSREQTLPVPANAPRVRRLGMFAIPRTAHREFPTADENAAPQAEELTADTLSSVSLPRPARPESTTGLRLTDDEVRNLKRGRDGAYRQENWEIGRVAERAGIHTPLRNATFPERSRYKAKLKFAASKRKSVAKVAARETRGKKKALKRKK